MEVAVELVDSRNRGDAVFALIADGHCSPHPSKFGQDIWGLGTILYARNYEGGLVVDHDGNNEPAINTAARLNPAAGTAS